MPTSKQRRQAERRRLERQLRRRQQRHDARKRITLITSIIGTLAIVGVVVGFLIATTGEDKPHNDASGAASPGTCSFKSAGTAARKVQKPPAKVATTGTVDVDVKTSQGSMIFRLNRKAAPCAAANFISLAEQKYFDGTPCHRVTTSGIYVLQCGDPTGTGSGGPGYSFADELTGKEKYTRGVLAMANSGPDTNGSQFFIVYKESALGSQYTVFGAVTAGLNVVEKVAAKGAATGQDGKPKLPISITSATVEK